MDSSSQFFVTSHTAVANNMRPLPRTIPAAANDSGTPRKPEPCRCHAVVRAHSIVATAVQGERGRTTNHDVVDGEAHRNEGGELRLLRLSVCQVVLEILLGLGCGGWWQRKRAAQVLHERKPGLPRRPAPAIHEAMGYPGASSLALASREGKHWCADRLWSHIGQRLRHAVRTHVAPATPRTPSRCVPAVNNGCASWPLEAGPCGLACGADTRDANQDESLVLLALLFATCAADPDASTSKLGSRDRCIVATGVVGGAQWL